MMVGKGLSDCQCSEIVIVPSPGWMEKAAKMEDEAKARISEIKRQIVL